MSDEHWPSVSVVMPVLNEADHLRAAVDAILAQDYPGQLDVCLALGPSVDTTDEVARRLTDEHPSVRTVTNPSGRTPSGLNAAIRATHGEVVVRVDGHALLPLGYVTRAVRTLRRTGAVNVGGTQRAVGATPFEHAVAVAMSSPFGMGGAKFHTGGTEGPTDTVYLGVFARHAIEAVGLFDESLIRNQDYELNVRLRKAGGVVWFDPELSVDYRPRPTASKLARQFFEYGAWKRHVLRLHPGSVRPRQLVPPVALLSIVAAVVASPWLPWALVVPAAYLAAVVTFTIGLARRDRRAQFMSLCLVFPTMHMSWAAGFLVGRR